MIIKFMKRLAIALLPMTLLFFMPWLLCVAYWRAAFGPSEMQKGPLGVLRVLWNIATGKSINRYASF